MERVEDSEKKTFLPLIHGFQSYLERTRRSFVQDNLSAQRIEGSITKAIDLNWIAYFLTIESLRRFFTTKALNC